MKTRTATYSFLSTTLTLCAASILLSQSGVHTEMMLVDEVVWVTLLIAVLFEADELAVSKARLQRGDEKGNRKTVSRGVMFQRGV